MGYGILFPSVDFRFGRNAWIPWYPSAVTVIFFKPYLLGINGPELNGMIFDGVVGVNRFVVPR